MNQQMNDTRTIEHYYSYGIEIRSTLRLPELAYGSVPDREATPLEIADGPVLLSIKQRDAPGGYCFNKDGSTFWWNEVGAFFVNRDGSVVIIDRFDGVTDDLLAFPLLGPIFSEVLRRRKFYTLHASAAEIDGCGVVFMADKGTGKSTSVSALLQGDARLLSDDLVAFDPTTGVIKPGFAQIKLEAASAEHLIPHSDWIARSHVHDQINKTRVLVPRKLAQKDTPAGAIYMLMRGSKRDAVIRTLSRPEQLSLLLRFSFAPRFGKEALRGVDAEEHFRAAVEICNRVPVRVLETPLGLDRLDGLVRSIKADLGRQHD